jgi:hypothetical protein
MRAAMEEEIRAQLVANMELLQDNEQNWDEKVRSYFACQI